MRTGTAVVVAVVVSLGLSAVAFAAVVPGMIGDRVDAAVRAGANPADVNAALASERAAREELATKLQQAVDENAATKQERDKLAGEVSALRDQLKADLKSLRADVQAVQIVKNVNDAGESLVAALLKRVESKTDASCAEIKAMLVEITKVINEMREELAKKTAK